jgi:hypothetical protein
MTGQGCEFWDCNTFIGQRVGRRLAPAYEVTPGRLVDEMDRLGIAAAMSYHVLSHEHAPVVGNGRLLSELQGNPRLLPVWVVMPEHTDELPPPRTLVHEMLDAGVHMARMFPATNLSGHRFSLADWSVGGLLTELAAHRIPLVLDFKLFRRDEPPWDSIVDICERHPALPVVLVDVQGRNNRNLYPLLAKLPNLYIETAGLNVHHGIEDVCRRFGAERLLFGSGYPIRSMGGALLQTRSADIDESEREMIASGNLRRLLGAVKTRGDHLARKATTD